MSVKSLAEKDIKASEQLFALLVAPWIILVAGSWVFFIVCEWSLVELCNWFSLTSLFVQMILLFLVAVQMSDHLCVKSEGDEWRLNHSEIGISKFLSVLATVFWVVLAFINGFWVIKILGLQGGEYNHPLFQFCFATYWTGLGLLGAIFNLDFVIFLRKFKAQ